MYQVYPKRNTANITENLCNPIFTKGQLGTPRKDKENNSEGEDKC